MRRRKPGRSRVWQRWNKWQIIAVGVGGVAAVLVVLQLLYPGDRLVPGQQIDGQAVGWQQKSAVADMLDRHYIERQLKLYFGEARQPQYSPKLAEFGLTVKNADRLDAVAYPWYWRLVPTSLFWVQTTASVPEPDYVRNDAKLADYLSTKLGGSCRVTPVNATAAVQRDTIVAVASQQGGTCQESEVRQALGRVAPVLDKDTAVRVAMEPIAAKLNKSDIQPVVDTLNRQLGGQLAVRYDDKVAPLDAREVRKWLVFRTEGEVFDVQLDQAKADAYLQQKLAQPLERAAGVSKVSTHDFVETSRVDGQAGRKLDVAKTLENLTAYLLAKSDTVAAGEQIVQPQVQYTRSYSNTDTGLSALMKNYAESHPGTYGVSLIELDGKRRRAAFNDSQKFTTASTYKLYVAYSALKRVESGEFKWSDQVSGGRDLAKCFDDMIVKSDNPCAEALVARIGYAPITKDAQSIVSPNTTFLDRESYKTTAGDLSTFMASLATGQISLRPDSQARFLDALKRNVYRQGIPAGASGSVADKVGFLEGFLHDAAIVYSPSGTYVLSIMTDKSSWANIAELTREIEKLRSQ